MGSRTALVVDDSADVRALVAEILAAEGFDVRQARDGLEAFDYLADGGRPHVIVLDLLMPVMDGWRFLRLVQEFPSLQGIPVIALSGFRGSAGDARAVDAIVPKPFDPDLLARTVAEVVARHPTA